MSPRSWETELRVYGPGTCGTDGYPIRWHYADNGIPALKDLVRMAAGYRCVRCGHPYRNGEHGSGEWSPCDAQCSHPPGEHRTTWDIHGVQHVEARWRILTVHHLDGDKLNCRWWNLAALCQRCHLTIQGRVLMARVWPWEHSDWFKPYVAGFYAWSYLGEDLSRAEVEARMDELLALEQLVSEARTEDRVPLTIGARSSA